MYADAVQGDIWDVLKISGLFDRPFMNNPSGEEMHNPFPLPPSPRCYRFGLQVVLRGDGD